MQYDDHTPWAAFENLTIDEQDAASAPVVADMLAPLPEHVASYDMMDDMMGEPVAKLPAFLMPVAK